MLRRSVSCNLVICFGSAPSLGILWLLLLLDAASLGCGTTTPTKMSEELADRGVASSAEESGVSSEGETLKIVLIIVSVVLCCLLLIICTWYAATRSRHKKPGEGDEFFDPSLSVEAARSHNVRVPQLQLSSSNPLDQERFENVEKDIESSSCLTSSRGSSVVSISLSGRSAHNTPHPPLRAPSPRVDGASGAFQRTPPRRGNSLVETLRSVRGSPLQSGRSNDAHFYEGDDGLSHGPTASLKRFDESPTRDKPHLTQHHQLLSPPPPPPPPPPLPSISRTMPVIPRLRLPLPPSPSAVR
eukprot:NODE_2528_length_1177_cov_20.799645_g2309_i0.p1 GENE.NODE_2528_length_1177_cov_20.799645_g2309_i0~~NODE_2528_length_1177_cov_20.799645_g2309_i0.p1  ORF type:complete len:300 (+),score=27.33 NODE_2528_length_1177_cov_20.799645_g2309_i0:110-1009(+)